ncbi:MAG: hypothetical protein AAGH71_05970 [Planctomycetota bacterium]
MHRNTVMLLAAAGLVQAASEASGQVREWVGGRGSWTIDANWSPNGAPFGPLTARLSDAADNPFITNPFEIDAFSSLEVLSPGAIVDIESNSQITLTGTASINNGLIRLNRTAEEPDALFRPAGPVEMMGTGEIQMLSDGPDSRILSSGTGTLLNGPMHTIRGVGQINCDMQNQGRLAADSSIALEGNSLVVFTDIVNSGRLASTTGSLLQFSTVDVTQTSNGEIVAEGGEIEIVGLSTFTGGIFDSNGGGVIRIASNMFLDGIDNQADRFEISPGATASVLTGGIHNDGTLDMHPGESASNSVLIYQQSGPLSGTGVVRMLRGGSDTSIRTAGGSTITHGPDHTIRGVGQIDAAIDNAGTIIADPSIATGGDVLDVFTNDKTNTGEMRAVNGGVLRVGSIEIDQTGGGRIIADGAAVELGQNSLIIGGELTSIHAGLWRAAGGRCNIDGTVLSGEGIVSSGASLAVPTSTLENNGTVTINPENISTNATLLVTEDLTISGTGTMDFVGSGPNDAGISATVFSPIPSLTNGADHTLAGLATVNVPMINEGVIEVGRPFGAFTLTRETVLAASGTMRTTLGEVAGDAGLLRITSPGSVQLGGTLELLQENGAALSSGDEYVIVDGVYTGTYDAVVPVTDDELITRVFYEADEVVVRVRCLADVNLDSTTNDSDFFAWVTAFVADPRTEDQETACDINLDGTCTDSDFFAWVTLFVANACN